jgi:ADP-ribosyl-[dinitrogen reductase] hydrolase
MIVASAGDGQLSKLDLLEYFANYPYKNLSLKTALSLHPSAPALERDVNTKPADIEAYYQKHHPLLKLILASSDPSNNRICRLPGKSSLPSSGFVLHTLVAALYAFFATPTFTEGAITAVNMGDDADTVGAVYGGLAGCWYACEEEISLQGSPFWTDNVKEWRDALVKRKELADGWPYSRSPWDRNHK